ncbi:hypothetical protein [Veronia nyctiphanis]|nr:hypothetical protein [Veronia nyctiphanis]
MSYTRYLACGVASLAILSVVFSLPTHSHRRQFPLTVKQVKT